MLKKLYPFGLDNNLESSFKILLVAEGYRATDKGQFTADCQELVSRLLEYAPFNLTRRNPGWISIYSAFEESANSNIAVDAVANNRTAFDGSYDSATHSLTFDITKVTAWVDSAEYRYQDSLVPVNSMLSPGNIPWGRNNTLIVLLTPALAGHPSGADFSHAPVDDEYYFVATTKDKKWWQLVIRAICLGLGLGTEFEVAGDDFLEPVSDEDKFMPYNLEWLDSPPGAISGMLKWYSLFSATQRVVAPTVHSKSDTGTPDETISTEAISWPKVEFWEGGGGFRSKVYRSAKDCLLRRKVASTNMPIREHAIGLCPACTHFLQRVIL